MKFWNSIRCYAAITNKNKGKNVKKLFGRPSNNLTSGIVGLANVGKSTFFQAITKSELGNPANYPFATIEPEEARVLVPSYKLNKLQELYQSKKKINSILKIFDIAGLVRGASDNKGLGNAFLNDIRSVDGIFQIVRAFKDSEITHIEGNVDPIRDLTIVQDELILKDMEFIENSIEKLNVQLKHKGNKPIHEISSMENQLESLTIAYDLLMEGQKIINKKDWKDDHIDALNIHNLLTTKPSVILVNVNEEDYLRNDNEFLNDIKNWVNEFSPDSPIILFSADHETKLNNQQKEIGINESYESSSALPIIIQEMRKVLNLISFYTCGEIEARQWTIRENSTCPNAAGIIHTDFEKTFINAELIKFDDVKDLNPPFDEKILRSKGKIQRVGKTYIVEDGDILHFKAASAKKK
ncbi:Ylf2 protein [Pichia kluyveri]|uniref:Obg-like ATPase homolog n=1 Tax=Pichia kluyveri TaxID=36015 RepID=A0AAV5R9W5_PICKL|nr:Ylf2 protein [Pichia kluyveri]